MNPSRHRWRWISNASSAPEQADDAAVPVARQPSSSPPPYSSLALYSNSNSNPIQSPTASPISSPTLSPTSSPTPTPPPPPYCPNSEYYDEAPPSLAHEEPSDAFLRDWMAPLQPEELSDDQITAVRRELQDDTMEDPPISAIDRNNLILPVDHEYLQTVWEVSGYMYVDVTTNNGDVVTIFGDEMSILSDTAYIYGDSIDAGRYERSRPIAANGWLSQVSSEELGEHYQRHTFVADVSAAEPVTEAERTFPTMISRYGDFSRSQSHTTGSVRLTWTLVHGISARSIDVRPLRRLSWSRFERRFRQANGVPYHQRFELRSRGTEDLPFRLSATITRSNPLRDGRERGQAFAE